MTRNNLHRLMRTTLALLLLLTACSGGGGTKGGSVLGYQEKGKSTPEETIEAFVGEVAGNNLPGALSLCAIQSMSDGFDLEALTERMMAYQQGNNMSAPSEYGFYQDLNTITTAQAMGRQIQTFSMSFLLTEDEVEEWLMLTPVVLRDEPEKMARFMEAIDPKRLSSLTVEEIVEFPLDERMVESYGKQVAVYGADEMKEYVVLYRLGGQYYSGGIQTIRYDKEWKVYTLYSPLMGQSYFCNVVPIDRDMWDDAMEELEDGSWR